MVSDVSIESGPVDAGRVATTRFETRATTYQQRRQHRPASSSARRRRPFQWDCDLCRCQFGAYAASVSGDRSAKLAWVRARFGRSESASRSGARSLPWFPARDGARARVRKMISRLESRLGDGKPMFRRVKNKKRRVDVGMNLWQWLGEKVADGEWLLSASGAGMAGSREGRLPEMGNLEWLAWLVWLERLLCPSFVLQPSATCGW